MMSVQYWALSKLHTILISSVLYAMYTIMNEYIRLLYIIQCNSLYNGMTGKNLDRLQKLQNKSARIIHCKPPSTHITPLLKELHWLPVRERIHHKALTLVYKCLHNLSPNYLTNLLKVRQSNYNTRSSSRTPLHTPRTYKSVGDQAFTAFAPKLWNNLPVNLKECTSISTFKKMLKSHLFKP